MKAWQIAASEKSRTLSRHIGDTSQVPADRRYIEELQRKFARWQARKNHNSNCMLCEKDRRVTTGFLPSIGTIMKCADCQDEYNDIRRSLQILEEAPE